MTGDQDGPGCELCAAPAAAQVSAPPAGLLVVRPVSSPVPIGHPLCVDCAHHALDLMLLHATPQPDPGQLR